MTTNFRRFNARIGVIFVFQDKVDKLLTWKSPTKSSSLLAVFTVLCLYPRLLPLLPPLLLMYFVMVPAFIARHPPLPALNMSYLSPSHARFGGPASAPAAQPRPATEYSTDFFRNMRDLQNSMEDFSVAHDRLIALFAPLTNFSDETVSSAVFVGLFTSVLGLLCVSEIIPWKFVVLVAGWVVIGRGHPSIQAVFNSIYVEYAELINDGRQKVISQTHDWAHQEIILDEQPAVRQVEVFELQHNRRLNATDEIDAEEGEDWEPWLFSPNIYDLQNPQRIAGNRPAGTQFFEDVIPPAGWEWMDKKWSLDPQSSEWVEERMVTNVVVETDGEQRWVYDLAQLDQTSASDRDDQRRGEWRRRRWVRRVRRRIMRH